MPGSPRTTQKGSYIYIYAYGIKKNINANLYILYLRLDFSSPSIHHLSKTGDVRRGVFFSWKTSRFVAGTDRDGALLQKPRQCFLECKTLHGKNYWNLDPKRTTILKWLHHLYLENWTTKKKEAHTHTYTHVYRIPYNINVNIVYMRCGQNLVHGKDPRWTYLMVSFEGGQSHGPPCPILILHTPQKTNMEPHIHPIEKENDQNHLHLGVPC